MSNDLTLEEAKAIVWEYLLKEGTPEGSFCLISEAYPPSDPTERESVAGTGLEDIGEHISVTVYFDPPKGDVDLIQYHVNKKNRLIDKIVQNPYNWPPRS